MKKIVFPLLILCLYAFKGQAQIGIKGGVNFSYLSGFEEIVLIKEPGFAFQFAAMYKHAIIDERLAIQPELKYIRKAASYQLGDYDVDGYLNYIELPVMGVFSIFEGALGVHAGPQFGYLLSARYEFENEEDADLSFTDTDRDNYNNFDIGLALGASLHLDYFFIEIRHNAGLISIDKHIVIDGTTRKIIARNYSAELSVGCFF